MATHLHVHTKYSLRDSIIDYDDLINRLKSIKQKSIAITDHGNIFASVSIYKKLKAENIKYIHGCEMYICDDASIKDQNNKYYHLVLLCKNEIGRINLNKLISIANLDENFYSKPRIDFEILKKHKEGLIVLSACLAGEISKFLLKDDIIKAKERALRYKKEFENDYYLEIQSRKEKYQIEINKKIIKLAKELNIAIVTTTDAHYVSKEDKKYHDVFSYNSNYKEDGEGNSDCYIQSEEEIRNNLQYLDADIINQAISNTDLIAKKCDVDLPLSAPIIPHIDIPDKYKNEREWLIDICNQGFEKRGINNLSLEERQIYIDRYNYELNAVDEMDFLGYYLMVYTYANKVRRRGIARGSGGGSLLCYLMNITDIDPIEHKLYFERFIDVGSLDLLREGKITKKELKVPDVDLDFGSQDREEVIKYLVKKYKQKHVACIGRFNYNQSKGTLTDIGRALNIDFEVIKQITKDLGDYDLKDLLFLIDENKNNSKKSELIQKFEKYIKLYPDLFEISSKLIGLPSSFGLHPCGRVIVMDDLDYYTASCYHDSGERYLQGDMHDIEDLGIVKIDALGLRTVDVIYDTLDLIEKDYEYINPKKMNYKDEKILQLFKNGDTVGIFQFESFGMRSTLRDIKPEGIEDLSIANALYRPGAMAYIKNYCNRKHGKEEIKYLHEDLNEILGNSFGIMVFQEQLIEIGRLAKLRNPDTLRKATGKKDKKLLDKIKPELYKGLEERKWNIEQLNQLWNDMLEFAKYAFNKSHSSAYAIIAFMTAKLKTYHPLEFYVSLMNSYEDKGSEYIKNIADNIHKDLNDHGIVMSSFNFRKDHRKCNIEKNKINYSIPLIKDCNKAIANELYELTYNIYLNFVELLYDISTKTSINTRQLNILIKLDFFKEFGISKVLDQINETFKLFKNGASKQFDVNKIEDEIIKNIVKRFSRLSPSGKTFMDLNCKAILKELEEYYKATIIKDYTIKEKMEFQKEYLGYIDLTTEKEEDRKKLMVLEVNPLISKFGEEKPWCYVIDEISIGSGKKNRLNIYPKTFEAKPIHKNDILFAKRVEKNKKGYWYLLDYDIINDI